LVEVAAQVGGLPPELRLVYEGAFRVPAGDSDQTSFDYGGTAPGFDPVRRSLWLVGHDHHQRAAELSIPDVRRSGTVAGHATAQLLRPFRDLLQGRLGQIGSVEGKIGGILPTGSDLIVTAWIYYDAGEIQTLSHYRVSANGTVTGPVQLGSQPRQAGFVSGYMTPIPAAWQAEFGGPALTGQCCVSIISRSSLGPALSVFDPAHVGVRAPVPATRVLAYPIDHPTLGTYEDGPLYNGTVAMGGVVFPEGTGSVLFFGRIGQTAMCYGVGTNNPQLHLRRVPGTDGLYCYDPIVSDQGAHGYPYAPFFWAYRASDLVAVRRGERKPWDITPYASGPIELPFLGGAAVISGVAYDSALQRIFLVAPYQDGNRPLIHVLRLGDVTTPPGEPPPPVETVPIPPVSRPWTSPPTGRAGPRP
jgi:hypothetical protein